MITPSFGLTATERVLPKLALDFTTASLDARVTFTRTTDATHPATYTNSSGIITAATNDQPRFDYDPVTLACKGLLIEESRTNLCKQSSAWATSPWSKTFAGTASSPTVTENYATSPDGTTNATRIQMTLNGGTTTADQCYVIQSITVANATAYTGSFWAKTNDGTTKTVSFRDSGANIFNTLKTITPTWQRFSVSGTSTSTSCVFAIWLRGAIGTSNDCDISVWGAQLEAGAFATSYIPTTTTALTRNADVAVMTGTNFSSWFNASEGTCYAEVQFNGYTTGTLPKIGLAISNGSTTERIQSWAATSTSVTSRVVATNASQAALTNTVVDITQNKLKVAFAYKANNFGASSNAGSVQIDTTGIVASPDRAYICASEIDGLSGQLNGTVAKIKYWRQRLTNVELQSFSKV